MLDAKGQLQYRAIKALIQVLALVPRRLMNRIAVPLGVFWHRIDKHHRDIALDNMSKAYGKEIDGAEVRRRVRATFIQLTTASLELPSLLKINRENLDKYARFSGTQNMEDALSSGKSTLFLTAHLGNWELMGLATTLKFNLSCNMLARPLDFAPMDKILTEIRCRTGGKVIDKIRSTRAIGNVLGGSGTLSILLDQNASWYDGAYVPFFGRTACTNRGFALFALRYDPVVLPIFNIRQADGRYKVMFDRPVPLVRSGDINRDIVENTANFNRIIEKHIRMAPDNWLWVHRRWRLKEIPEKAKKKMAALTF